MFISILRYVTCTVVYAAIFWLLRKGFLLLIPTFYDNTTLWFLFSFLVFASVLASFNKTGRELFVIPATIATDIAVGCWIAVGLGTIWVGWMLWDIWTIEDEITTMRRIVFTIMAVQLHSIPMAGISSFLYKLLVHRNLRGE